MTESEVIARWRSLPHKEREAARLTVLGYSESDIATALRCEADEAHRIVERACRAVGAEDTLGLALRIAHYGLDTATNRPQGYRVEDAASSDAA